MTNQSEATDNQETLPTPVGGAVLHLDDPLVLSSGALLRKTVLAYACYGTLNPDRDNAILVCHALTGDHYMAETHPITHKEGWWSRIVGPGLPLDTDRFAVFCVNVPGSCLGSSGPASVNPETGNVYGLDFPMVTIPDMIHAQHRLMQHHGIDRWHAVIGGSMGAMQVLSWVSHFPEALRAAVVIAGATRHSAQNIAFHEVGRQAVMADPEWHNGDYLIHDTRPERGLAVARMAAHVTYLSEKRLHEKFGRMMQNRENLTFGFDADFQIESYLRHQGRNFVKRFDANSYLYLTRAMDYFDLENEFGSLDRAFNRASDVKFCVLAFTSDWLFPAAESRHLVKALNRIGAEVTFSVIETSYGHDAFLLDVPPFIEMLQGFVRGIRGTTPIWVTSASTGFPRMPGYSTSAAATAN